MVRRMMKNKKRKSKYSHLKAINLYKFIRLILGTDIADRQIAIRWKMDEKNFHEFKRGVYPVPRLGKLEELADVLGVNKHLVFQVASGTPARKVFHLIKNADLSGQIRLLSGQLDEAHQKLVTSERRYRDLFNNANDAIFIADVKTGILLDCNKQAELLIRRSRAEIIGWHMSILHPAAKRKYYIKHFFNEHIRRGRMNDLRKADIVRKDGSIVPVYINASVMEIDGRKIIQGIFRDISQMPA